MTDKQKLAQALEQDMQGLKEMVVKVERMLPEATNEFHSMYMAVDQLKQKLAEISNPEKFAKVISIYKSLQ